VLKLKQTELTKSAFHSLFMNISLRNIHSKWSFYLRAAWTVLIQWSVLMCAHYLERIEWRKNHSCIYKIPVFVISLD